MSLLSPQELIVPEELIAKTPAVPRDAARLFVYDTKKDSITFDTFRNIANFLDPRSLLVLNDTKVVPARIRVRKATGGEVELLLLVDEYKKGDETIKAFADRKMEVGEVLSFVPGWMFAVTGQEKQIFTLWPNSNITELFALLHTYGTIPLPKYIKGTPLSQDDLRREYQTIFAKVPGSVAAPTASLHFTEEVFESLKQAEIQKAYITLNVGRGTFAPVTPENIRKGKLHTEYFEIAPAALQLIAKTKKSGEKIVAVGTTTTRCLESVGKEFLRTKKQKITGSTDIFIRPPFHFEIMDALITNFHLPGSSLLMLLEAFLAHKGSRKTHEDLYKIAISERFRFYSFGDAMLIV